MNISELSEKVLQLEYAPTACVSAKPFFDLTAWVLAFILNCSLKNRPTTTYAFLKRKEERNT